MLAQCQKIFTLMIKREASQTWASFGTACFWLSFRLKAQPHCRHAHTTGETESEIETRGDEGEIREIKKSTKEGCIRQHGGR